MIKTEINEIEKKKKTHNRKYQVNQKLAFQKEQ